MKVGYIYIYYINLIYIKKKKTLNIVQKYYQKVMPN